MNAINECKIKNVCDDKGNPTGGSVDGVGLVIEWQNGPLVGRGPVRTIPNGAFVETVISAAKQRIEFFQEAAGGRFACGENAAAIECLQHALNYLDFRTRDREERKVEGTHNV